MKGQIEKLKLEDIYRLLFWFFNGKKKQNFVRQLNLKKSNTLNCFILTDTEVKSCLSPENIKIKFHENLPIESLMCALTKNVVLEEIKPNLDLITPQNLNYVLPIKPERLYDSKIFINSFISSKCPNKQNRFTQTTKYFLVSLDLEMVYSERGKEVARVSILDHKGNTLYDKFIKSDYPIVDYCTKYSGVTQEILEKGISNKQMKGEISTIIGKDTVVLGHGLDNDLGALEMYHEHLIDTSYLFLNTESRRVSLKQLASVYLNKKVHEHEHSSVEDSLLCLELLSLKIQQIKMATNKLTEEILLNAHINTYKNTEDLLLNYKEGLNLQLTTYKKVKSDLKHFKVLNLFFYNQNNKIMIEISNY